MQRIIMKKLETVSDFLHAIDAIGLKLVVWMKGDDDEPIWSGRAFDTPWWVADLPLDYSGEENYIASFRNNINEEGEDPRPGFVLYVEDFE